MATQLLFSGGGAGYEQGYEDGKNEWMMRGEYFKSKWKTGVTSVYTDYITILHDGRYTVRASFSNTVHDAGTLTLYIMGDGQTTKSTTNLSNSVSWNLTAGQRVRARVTSGSATNVNIVCFCYRVG